MPKTRIGDLDDGSSPHTRGLPPRPRGSRFPAGIIPAHAGFTWSIWPATLGIGDHPRTRGVYAEFHRPGSRRLGSSPHTRGLLGLEGVPGVAVGIIPAHAGFTRAVYGARSREADHPRTRGVYLIPGARTTTGAGSSPHTRGLPRGHNTRKRPGGIIPAHAGFTQRLVQRAVWRGDHPRTRGVYQLAVRQRRDHHRIIPAHAGFTRPWRGC